MGARALRRRRSVHCEPSGPPFPPTNPPSVSPCGSRRKKIDPAEEDNSYLNGEADRPEEYRLSHRRFLTSIISPLAPCSSRDWALGSCVRVSPHRVRAKCEPPNRRLSETGRPRKELPGNARWGNSFSSALDVGRSRPGGDPAFHFFRPVGDHLQLRDRRFRLFGHQH